MLIEFGRDDDRPIRRRGKRVESRGLVFRARHRMAIDARRSCCRQTCVVQSYDFSIRKPSKVFGKTREHGGTFAQQRSRWDFARGRREHAATAGELVKEDFSEPWFLMDGFIFDGDRACREWPVGQSIDLRASIGKFCRMTWTPVRDIVDTCIQLRIPTQCESIDA